jgi:hypothetical protein
VPLPALTVLSQESRDLGKMKRRLSATDDKILRPQGKSSSIFADCQEDVACFGMVSISCHARHLLANDLTEF